MTRTWKIIFWIAFPIYIVFSILNMWHISETKRAKDAEIIRLTNQLQEKDAELKRLTQTTHN